MNSLLHHNRPPTAIDTARSTMADLGAFMASEPVITTDELARQAKLFRDRARLALADMEAERDKQVRPLNEQVDTINAAYNTVSKPLGEARKALIKRLNVFAIAEEDKRLAAAAEARRLADEADMAAHEAERAECEAMEDAEVGVVNVDLVGAIQTADARFAECQRAERDAARAERDAHVRIGGGFGKVATLRNVETLVVSDPARALAGLGLTVSIEEAIIKSARLYRKLRNQLPDGVTATYERSL